MKDDNKPNQVVISAILEKIINGKIHIFVQTRWKPQVSPTYTGLLEIPAGAVEPYENIYDALYREVKEETGLIITRILDDYQSEISENRPHDKGHVFQPFMCQQSIETNGGLPWVGFVFRCRVTGEVSIQKEEARDPRWMTIPELEEIINSHPESIFPLQYPVLKHYKEIVKKEVSA
jgi:8-oxo-dGTP diphosphatase